MSTHTPFMERKLDNNPISSEQKLYRFPNGYGASVVRGLGTYGSIKGLWELAVIQFEEEDWSLTYRTPITDDVIGSLTPEDVEGILDRIAALPEKADD